MNSSSSIEVWKAFQNRTHCSLSIKQPPCSTLVIDLKGEIYEIEMVVEKTARVFLIQNSYKRDQYLKKGPSDVWTGNHHPFPTVERVETGQLSILLPYGES